MRGGGRRARGRCARRDAYLTDSLGRRLSCTASTWSPCAAAYFDAAVGHAIHHFFANDVRGNLQGQFARVWHAVARHFATNPDVLGYELYNEPLDPPRPALTPSFRRGCRRSLLELLGGSAAARPDRQSDRGAARRAHPPARPGQGRRARRPVSGGHRRHPGSRIVDRRRRGSCGTATGRSRRSRHRPRSSCRRRCTRPATGSRCPARGSSRRPGHGCWRSLPGGVRGRCRSP